MAFERPRLSQQSTEHQGIPSQCLRVLIHILIVCLLTALVCCVHPPLTMHSIALHGYAGYLIGRQDIHHWERMQCPCVQRCLTMLRELCNPGACCMSQLQLMQRKAMHCCISPPALCFLSRLDLLPSFSANQKTLLIDNGSSKARWDSIMVALIPIPSSPSWLTSLLHSNIPASPSSGLLLLRQQQQRRLPARAGVQQVVRETAIKDTREDFIDMSIPS